MHSAPVQEASGTSRPSQSESSHSTSSRDAGDQLASIWDSSRAPGSRDAAETQNEDTNNAHLPTVDHIHPSVRFHQSSTHGMPQASSPSAEHDPAMQSAADAGDDAIGDKPGARGSGLGDPFPRKRFGLNKSQQNVHRSPMDYRAKYAEDPPCKELEPDARVWHVYNDESEIFDNDMIIEASDNLDILLVFAGLFSSVLTTFVAQTSQALSPDNTAVSNSFLAELVALQRAQANGTSFELIPHADTSFIVALSDIWVNGLWFTSLMFSLTTALLAVLAKQWLRQYSSFIAGSARERALIRQFRYASFDKWGVQLIIGLLPLILHLSLFLFMAGLAVFLYALNDIIATVVASVAGSLLGTYIVMNLLPILAIGCPYRTPLTPLLHSFIYGPGREFGVFCWRFILKPPYTFLHDTLQTAGLLRTESRRYGYGPPKDRDLRQAERKYVNRHQSQWIDSALSWLASATSDPSAKLILLEALGTTDTRLNVDPLLGLFGQEWRNISFPPDTPCDEARLGRLIRSTASQSNDFPKFIMLGRLLQTPICVEDPAMVVAIAACRHTSTFDWGNNNPVVLPPHGALAFVIEHYTMFNKLVLPMWMWLSICIQAITTPREEAILASSLPSTSYRTIDPLLFAIWTSNTYNTAAERNKISVWFQERMIPDDLQRTVDDTSMTYSTRYALLSLAMFLAVIQEHRSFDEHWIDIDDPRHHSVAIGLDIPSMEPISPSLSRTSSEAGTPIPHPRPSHPPHTLPDTVPSEYSAPPTSPIQKHQDRPSSYALQDVAGDSSSSASRIPDNSGSPLP